MARCCSIFKGVLAALFCAVFAALSALAWPHAVAVSVEPAVVVVGAAGMAYFAVGTANCVFEPPNVQRGAFHGVALVSFWWMAVMGHVVAKARRWSAAQCETPDADAEHWQTLTIVCWAAASVVTVYALLRMCTEDCIARTRRKKALHRRRAARQGPAKIPMQSVYEG